MNLMTDSCRSYDSYETYAESHARHASAPDDYWLTAMHAAYESNQQDMETVFSRIRKEQEPTLELVTFNRDSGQYQSRDKQRFFGTRGFEEVGLPLPAPETNQLKSTTEWCQKLARKLGGTRLQYQSLLHTDVEWVPPKLNNVVMIQNKKR